VTLSGIEFLQRFLQHVLPRGCMKCATTGSGVRPAVANSIRPGLSSPSRDLIPSSRRPSWRRLHRPPPILYRCVVHNVERGS
jgi:hypothetical protein